MARYFDNIEGESLDTKKHDFLLNLGPIIGQNRSKSALQLPVLDEHNMVSNGKISMVLRRGPTVYTKYGLSVHWMINKSRL